MQMTPIYICPWNQMKPTNELNFKHVFKTYKKLDDLQFSAAKILRLMLYILHLNQQSYWHPVHSVWTDWVDWKISAKVL